MGYPEEIGEYSGTVKEIRPVTIATYQVMTTRRKGVYSHLELLDARDWGLIDRIVPGDGLMAQARALAADACAADADHLMAIKAMIG